MDLKQIKELMASMEKAKIRRLKIKTEKGYEVLLEKDGDDLPHPRHPPHHGQDSHSHQLSPHFPHHTLPSHRHAGEEHAAPKNEQREAKGTFVTSPMVGTFYSSSSPEDPLFVKVGDEVDEDTVVCIIEAMKVMNEVKAGAKGRVAEVLVENGHPVEFGTKMIRIV